VNRAEIAAAVVRLLQDEPASLRDLAAAFDEGPAEIRSVLGWLAGEGVVQNMGGSWRLVPGSAPPGVYAIPEIRAVPAVAQAEPSADPSPPDVVSIEPAEPTPPITEPADMAKTKACNTCKKRFPLTAFGINRATPDGHERRCKLCTAEYREQRKHQAASPAKGRGKRKTTINMASPLVTPQVVEQLVAAIAEEPAPLLHATPASEVAGMSLEIIPVIGALVLQQHADVGGRHERQALLIPRSELRALIDSLTRHV
jgi:hypothetical protein